MVLRRRPGSTRYMMGASLVAASSAVTSQALGEILTEQDDAGLHRVSLDHFAPPNARAFATLPHRRVAQRPA